MTSVFDEMRADPAAPVALTPQAAQDGDPASGDGSGFDFTIFVNLGAQLGSLAAGMKADRDRRAAMVPPSNEQLQANGVVPASGILFLDLGSVPQGRVWQVRRIVIGGPKATDTPAGSAFLYKQGAAPVDFNTPGIVDSFPSFSTGAQGNTYGTHQLFGLPGVHLWVAITGATQHQQFTAAADVEDWDEESFESTFAE
jgi:hypothetical protein